VQPAGAVLGEVRAARRHLAHHRRRAAAGRQRDEGPRAVARRTAPGEVDIEPVVGVAAVVAEQPRRGVRRRLCSIVREQQIEVAVAVVVEREHAEPDALVDDARRGGDVGEDAGAVVAPQADGIVRELRDVDRAELRHEERIAGGIAVGAVGHHQIEVAVVVVVERLRAPSPAALAHAGGVRHVAEDARARVPVQPIPGGARVARNEDRGDEEVQAAVPVEVRRRGAHAVLVGADAGRHGAVGEPAGAVVPEEPALLEVGDDGQVGPAVAVEVAEARREREGAVLGADHPVERHAGGGRHLVEESRAGRAAIAEQVAHRPGDPGVDQRRLELGDVEVQVAVAVVIAERHAAADGIGADGHAARHGILGEDARAVVQVEEVARIRIGRGVQVEIAVVVDVRERRAARALRIAEVRRDGDVLEGAVAAVAIERVVVAAGEVEVGEPVAVAVADGRAARVPRRDAVASGGRGHPRQRRRGDVGEDLRLGLGNGADEQDQ
jgi:hypothetical protein